MHGMIATESVLFNGLNNVIYPLKAARHLRSTSTSKMRRIIRKNRVDYDEKGNEILRRFNARVI